MENQYEIMSIIPVIITLSVAFLKKDIIIALISGIISGMLMLTIETNNIFIGINAVTDVFKNISTAQTIIFILLIGALVNIIDRSGGVEGTIKFMTERRNIIKSKVGAQILTQLIGLLLFIDATSSIIVSSTIGSPFFKKYKIPKEKLALIANSTGAPIAWLIPFGGAGALMAGIINDLDIVNGDGFTYVLSAIPYQFYTFMILIIIFLSIIFNFELGSIKHVDYDINTESEIKFNSDIENKETSIKNMIFPILLLLVMIFSIMFITGKGSILRGNGQIAVMISAITTLILTYIYYRIQNIVSFKNYIRWSYEGIKNIFPIVFILILSFSFSNILELLQTANYLSSIVEVIPNTLIPVSIMILGAIMAFATGTSGGTVSILIPMILPLVAKLDINVSLVLGAIISGAVFGDQNSPISDSVILTSTATNVQIVDHIKTQLPYTTLALITSVILYLIAGFII